MGVGREGGGEEGGLGIEGRAGRKAEVEIEGWGPGWGSGVGIDDRGGD